MQRTLALCLLALTACTSPYGNYTKISDGYNARMADDTVHELSQLYPPASTHLTVSQPTQDAFGRELLKKLRETGYAMEQDSSIGDFFTGTPPASPAPPAPSSSNAELKKGKAHGKPVKKEDVTPLPVSHKSLGYIVDHIGEGFYRVTIKIGSTALSRVYKASDKDMVPAGAWTRKE